MRGREEREGQGGEGKKEGRGKEREGQGGEGGARRRGRGKKKGRGKEREGQGGSDEMFFLCW